MTMMTTIPPDGLAAQPDGDDSENENETESEDGAPRWTTTKHPVTEVP